MATLGINPSCREFRDRDQNEIIGGLRRFATLRSLGVNDLSNAPQNAIRQVVMECNNYFQNNPYEWFNQLEPILQQCGASYYDGSACHLDLIQWATNPTWRGLAADLRDQLLDNDLPFLREQLGCENISLLLVNGKSVLRKFKRIVSDIKEVEPIAETHGKTRMFIGRFRDRLKIVGWSTNIQSSFGVTRELRAAIAQRSAELAREDN